MSDELECVARVDVKTPGGREGDADSVLFYASDVGLSMLVTCRHGGEAEVLLTKRDIQELKSALSLATQHACD